MQLRFRISTPRTKRWKYRHLCSANASILGSPGVMKQTGGGWPNPLHAAIFLDFATLVFNGSECLTNWNPRRSSHWCISGFLATKSVRRWSEMHFVTNATQSSVADGSQVPRISFAGWMIARAHHYY